MELAHHLLSTSLQYQTAKKGVPVVVTTLPFSVNDQGTQHRAARVIEQDGYADELRLTEARRSSVSRCPPHTNPFICAFLSLCSQPSRFLLATQDRGWHTQRVFNLPQTTANIKARKATTALCQRAGWGWWVWAWGALCRTGAMLTDGWGLDTRRCSGRPGWGFCA